ncbi:glycine-rich domain-containing protein, partial [Anaplasma phagocytophilum]
MYVRNTSKHLSSSLRAQLLILKLLPFFCCVILMNMPNKVMAILSTPHTRFAKIIKEGYKGGMFDRPSMEVGLYDAWVKTYRWHSLERWEYQAIDVGTVLAYMKRDPSDGRLYLCACSRFSRLLSGQLYEEAAMMRKHRLDEVTNYEDLSFDKKLEAVCLSEHWAYTTYRECMPVDTSTPAVPAFCNVYARDLHMKALPMEFSKQSYFVPGLRVFRRQNSSSGQGYQKISAYIGPHDGYTGSLVGVSRYARCDKRYNAMEPQACSVGGLEDSNYGYAVVQSGDGVCLKYNYQGRQSIECVPSPELPIAVVSPSHGGLRMQFLDCQDKQEGKATKYCDFTMMPGEREKEFGFSVMKPKLKKGEYELEEEFRCLDKDGNVSSDQKAGKCDNSQKFYVGDPDSNVICYSLPNNETKQFYVKRGDRDYWIRELEKVLVANSFLSEQKRYAQCPDSQSIDIAKLSQEDIDKLQKRGRDTYVLSSKVYNFHGNQVLCRDNISYQYDNSRAFPYNGICSGENSVGVLEGYCKTRYKSLDNFQPIFLRGKDEVAPERVRPLNPIFQGMCVSNFPSHEYVYGAQESNIIKQGDGYIEYVLEVGEKNATCDFLKIEMWGAGESGSLSTGAVGKQGEYVMGLLKPDLKKMQYLSIKVGQGGIANATHYDARKARGYNTTVSLCDDFQAQKCSMELVARGGGQVAEAVTKGTSNLMHYRVSEGLTAAIGKNEVYTPYHGPYKSSGVLNDNEARCIRNPNDKSNNTQVIAPSNFPGTGGCARSDINVVQHGAHGRVKITCEKWSGPAGKIKKWRTKLACDPKTASAFKEIKKQANSVSAKTKKLFQEASTDEFCEYVADAPLFSNAVKQLAATANVSLENAKAVEQWMSSKLKPLEKALDTEKKVSMYEGIKISDVANA